MTSPKQQFEKDRRRNEEIKKDFEKGIRELEKRTIYKLLESTGCKNIKEFIKSGK